MDIFEEFLPDNLDELDGEEFANAVEAAVDAYIAEYGMPPEEELMG